MAMTVLQRAVKAVLQSSCGKHTRQVSRRKSGEVRYRWEDYDPASMGLLLKAVGLLQQARLPVRADTAEESFGAVSVNVYCGPDEATWLGDPLLLALAQDGAMGPMLDRLDEMGVLTADKVGVEAAGMLLWMLCRQGGK